MINDYPKGDALKQLKDNLSTIKLWTHATDVYEHANRKWECWNTKISNMRSSIWILEFEMKWRE